MAALLVSTALATVFVTPAMAQVAAPAPVRSNIDGNGVDLFLGTMNVDGPALSTGNGKAGMTWRKMVRGGGGWGDTLVGTLSVNGTTVYVAFGGVTDRFTQSGTTYTSTEGDGATLTHSGTVYTYTAADGTVAAFTTVYVGVYPYQSIQGNLVSVTKPDGSTFNYTYDSLYYCAASKQGGAGQICTQHKYAYAIGSITNSAQYELTFQYGNYDGTYDPDQVGLPSGWGDITGVTMSNAAIAGSSSHTQNFAFSYSGGNSYFTITDAMGRATAYRMVTQGVGGIKLPGSASEDVTVGYTGSRVTSVTTAAGTTHYGSTDLSGVRTVTVTDPGGHATIYTFDIASQRMATKEDALLHTTHYYYDGSGRLTKVIYPEGNYVQYTLDGRGNVKETRQVSKTPGTPADIVTTADYPTTCSNAATCNKPNWTIDAKGNETDYSYTATGDLQGVTAPAPVAGGARPAVVYGYTSVGGVSLVNSITTCASATTCAGTASETRTTIGYNSNLLPTSVTKAAGDGSVSATTTYGYDDVGNVTTVDGPLAGTSDTTTYRYDLDRERVGVISADPDGGGALKRRAVRTTYNPHGIATETEVGTVTDVTDAAWNAFASAQQATVTLDAADRPIATRLTAGGTTYAVTQTSYDSAGRVDCTAVRMNSALWGSLPASACTAQAAGSAGPDRITKVALYDALNRPSQVTTAYGQAEASTESTAFTDNGKVASVTDANNNTTTYGYDGFDRLSTTTYPGGSYEQVGYDPNGNVTSRRRRDGSSIGYTYDADNRMTFEDRVNQGIDEDVTNAYDLLGRLTATSTPNGHFTGFGYDALGRRVSETTTYGGTKISTYDAAGRRTRLAWPDGFYVDYDYDVLGEMTAVRENGAASGVGVLAIYAYDDLGNRKSVTRGNGVTTTYTYDPASQLASLTHDLAGTAYDETATFTYNPAGQIASRTSSNDAYAWNAAANVNRSYTTNALNQYTASGSVALGYDANGNLTSSGASTYTYGQHNQLWSVPGATLYYDPLDRLDVIIDNVTNTTFDYDGANLATEGTWGSSTIARRYVFGADVDEPLVWYEGSGTSDRRWLIADERGSVIAVTDGSGNKVAINSYDEYGIPGTTNLGRFQYTGQIWLPQVGMYYYKARMYSPSLGRFMQTDPIGYADGMNWYNYTGSDPVNGGDPSGTKAITYTGSIIPGVMEPFYTCVGNCSFSSGSGAAGVTSGNDSRSDGGGGAIGGVSSDASGSSSAQSGSGSSTYDGHEWTVTGLRFDPSFQSSENISNFMASISATQTIDEELASSNYSKLKNVLCYITQLCSGVPAPEHHDPKTFDPPVEHYEPVERPEEPELPKPPPEVPGASPPELPPSDLVPAAGAAEEGLTAEEIAELIALGLL